MSAVKSAHRPYLVDDSTGLRLRVGDDVRTFRGERGTLTDIQIPMRPSSTGRVYVRLQGTTIPVAFYPSVIGARWIGRTDGGMS